MGRSCRELGGAEGKGRKVLLKEWEGGFRSELNGDGWMGICLGISRGNDKLCFPFEV